MQESYLGNMDESEAEESNQAIVADTFMETKTDSESEDKLDS